MVVVPVLIIRAYFYRNGFAAAVLLGWKIAPIKRKQVNNCRAVAFVAVSAYFFNIIFSEKIINLGQSIFFHLIARVVILYRRWKIKIIAG